MSKKLNKSEAKALVQRYLALPKIGDSLNAKRLEIILNLMEENGEANLQDVVDQAFDRTNGALNILSKTIDDVFEKAKSNNFELKIVRDNYKGRPLVDRTLWIEGDEAMIDKLVEEMLANLMLPETNIQSHAIILNKKTITVCYAKKDKKLVKELIDLLEDRAYQKIEFKYFDDDLLGEKTEERITKNIERCDFVLCCESPAFYSDKEIKSYFLKDDYFDKAKFCIAIQNLGENGNRQICHNTDLHFYIGKDGIKKCFSELKHTKAEYAIDLAKRIVEKFSEIENDDNEKRDRNIEKLVEFTLDHDNYIENKAQRQSLTGLRSKKNQPEPEDNKYAVALELLSEWVNCRNTATLFALLGQYGMGKTFTSKVFAKKQIDKYKSDRKEFIPIYFDLRDFDHRILNHPGFDIWDIIDGILHKRKKADDDAPLKAKDIKDIWQRFNTVFVFDGLDEVISHIGDKKVEQLFISEIFKLIPDYRSKIMKPISSLRQKMLLTCRTDYFKSIAEQASFFQEQSRTDIDLKDDYESAILLPFDESQIKQYLSQVFKDKDANQLYVTLESIHNLAELAERPVLLNFLGEIIDDLESLMLSEKKITTASVYDRIVHKSFSRDNGKHEIPIEIKETLLEEIAAFLWKRADRRIDFSKLATFLSEYLANGTAAMKKLYYNKEEEALYKDLRNATLLVRSDEKDFGFSHTSVQEYFLARFIINEIQLKEYLSLDIEKVSPETTQFCIDLIVQMNPFDLNMVNEGISDGFVQGSSLCRKILFDLYLSDYHREKLIELSQPVNVSGLTLEDYTIIGQKDKYFNLKGAQMQQTFLYNCKLRYVELIKADFTASKWLRSHFQDVNMNHADFTDSKVYGKWRNVQVKDLKMKNADFQNLFVFKSVWQKNYKDSFLPPHTVVALDKLIHAKPHIDCGHTSIVHHCQVLNEKQALSSSHHSIILWNLESGKAIHHLEGHTSAVHHCQVVNEKQALSCSWDKTLILWDLKSGKALHQLKGHTSFVHHCQVVNEKQALSCSQDNTLILWNLESGKVIHHLKGHTSSVSHCELVNEKQALSCSRDNTLILWDLESGKAIQHLRGHTSAVFHCQVINEKQALSCSRDNTLILWDFESGKIIHHLKGHTSTVVHCQVIKEKQALSCSFDKSLILWDLESGKAIHHLIEHTMPIRQCEVVNEKQAMSSSNDKTLILWDLESGKAIHHLQGHTDWILHFQVINEKYALSCSAKTLILWDLESGKAIHHIQEHTSYIYEFQGVNEKQALSCSQDNTLILWNLESGKVIHHLKGHTSSVSHCELVNEKQALSCSDDNTLILWDLQSGRVIHHLQGHTSFVRHCQVVNEKQALSCSDDTTLILWDLVSGKAIHHLKGHTSIVFHCQLVSQKQALSCSEDNTLILWDIESGKVIHQLIGHTDMVIYCQVVSQKQALSCSEDDTLILWNLESGKVIYHLQGHKLRVRHCLLVNEKQALSCSDDTTLILWDLDSGIAIHHLKGHTSTVSFCLMVNAKQALSCSYDNTLILWNLESGKAIRRFEGHTDIVVHCSLIGSDMVGSCSKDGSMRIWDLNTGLELMSAYHLSDRGYAFIKNNKLTDYSENAWEHISFEAVADNGNKKQWYFDEVVNE